MQVDLTNNIKAIVLPEGARRVFIENTNTYGTKYLWYWDGNKSIEMTLDYLPESKIELLGVITDSIFPLGLISSLVKETGLTLPEIKDLMESKGIDLSKKLSSGMKDITKNTIVIINQEVNQHAN